MLEARSPNSSAFGILLRRYRLGAGLSQQTLADKARLSVDGIGALERGDRRTPQRETLALLAAALGLRAEQREVFEAAAERTSAPRASRGSLAADPLEDPASNLPLALSTFVGRDGEIRELKNLVRDQRLVTLTGAGGIGKTRTALRIGSALVAATDARVWLVELAPVATPALVISTIAAALGVQETPDRPLVDALIAFLKQREMWLILDNCEHLIDSVASATETLLRTCPAVRIIATSREPLRVSGEHVYRLPSLRVPSLQSAARLGATEATAYGSIVLFAQRARAAGQRFMLDDTNAPTIAEICRRLDGIPLAIELAAARTTLLSVRALLEQLDNRFRLLTAGNRAALPRQQTMRATIEWSYDLLSAREQQFFERLSVFAGGCTLAVATAVFADEERDAGESLELLCSLVDKSLLVVDFEWYEPRYRLLESFRQYAREKLAARGEEDLAQRLHARAFAALAERAQRSWDTASDAWAGQFEPELDNWRAALEWTLATRGDVPLGQAIVADLSNVWSLLSRGEGRRWIAAALELVDERTSSRIVAQMHYGRALLGAGADVDLASSEKALALYRAAGDELGVVKAQGLAGDALTTLGRPAAAVRSLSEALGVGRRLGARRAVAQALRYMAQVRIMQGDFSGARADLDEAAEIFTSVGAVESGAVNVSWSLADLESLRGEPELALGYASDAMEILRAMNDTQNVSRLLANMSAYHLALGHYGDAEACALEALGFARSQQLPHDLARGLERLAILAAMRPYDRIERRTEAYRRAARLLGFTAARSGDVATAEAPGEHGDLGRAFATLREMLGAAELAFLVAEGATMSEEDAITSSSPAEPI